MASLVPERIRALIEKRMGPGRTSHVNSSFRISSDPQLERREERHVATPLLTGTSIFLHHSSFSILSFRLSFPDSVKYSLCPARNRFSPRLPQSLRSFPLPDRRVCDHPLDQVRYSPTQAVQTRRQILVSGLKEPSRRSLTNLKTTFFQLRTRITSVDPS